MPSALFLRRAAPLALVVALLAGCGVDGVPQPPLRADGTQPPRVTITGEARVGVAGSF